MRQWIPRLAVAVCALCVHGPGTEAGVQKRSGKREFPQFQVCPVHLGRDTAGLEDPVLRLTGASGPGTFTAEGSRALVTLLSCDRIGKLEGGDGISVLIDNFRVVRWDVFSAHQKQYIDPHAADPGDPYVTDGATCYNNGDDVIGDQGQSKVKSTFDVDAARASLKAAYKSGVPFEEDFEKGAKAWMLVNAEVEPQSSGGNMLVLARSQRPDLFGTPTPGTECSAAVILVTKLKKSLAYVVDFEWNVGNIDVGQHTGEKGVPVLTVVIDTTPTKAPRGF